MNWPNVQLSQGLADIVRGVTFSQGDSIHESRDGFLPVLRAGNIAERLEIARDLVWIPERFVSERQRLRKNDIVMCTSSGSALVVGKTAIAEDDFDGSWGAFNAVLRPTQAVVPKFLYYWLQSSDFRAWRDRQAKGANIQNIRHSDLANLAMPLPAKSEQSRIVELLDEAARLCRLRREADAKAARILPALFLKMFGDPATNPMKWPVVPLSDFANAVSRRNPSTSPDEPFQYIDIAGVDGELGLITAAKRIVGRDAPSRARQVVRWRDTVVSTVRPYLRATALVPKELDNQIASTGFCVLRPREPNGYAWLFQLTRLQWFTEQLNARARGASYPAVTDADIFQLLIPLPCDSKIFEEFSGQYESVSKVLLTAGASSEKVGAIFNLMLQRAFSGELTARWREGHMNELLAEMVQQARVLNLPMPEELEALP
jgi:type I restriction enzyme S subunit